MHLLVISESGKFDSVLWKQAVEGVRLGMSVWGRQHDQADLSELVRAIIQDEPIKMRRLGDLYHIDVEALSDVWILKNLTDADLSRWIGPIRELSSHFARIEICEPYENDILIFPVGNRTLRDMNGWAAALAGFCAKHEIPIKITRCPLLQNTANVKYAYEINHTYLADASGYSPCVRSLPFRKSNSQRSAGKSPEREKQMCDGIPLCWIRFWTAETDRKSSARWKRICWTKTPAS
mgnify:CR=1 FL=1